MTLLIELTADEEARLKYAAQLQGRRPADIVAALVRALPEQATASCDADVEDEETETIEEEFRRITRKRAPLTEADFDAFLEEFTAGWETIPENVEELTRAEYYEDAA